MYLFFHMIWAACHLRFDCVWVKPSASAMTKSRKPILLKGWVPKDMRKKGSKAVVSSQSSEQKVASIELPKPVWMEQAESADAGPPCMFGSASVDLSRCLSEIRDEGFDMPHDAPLPLQVNFWKQKALYFEQKSSDTGKQLGVILNVLGRTEFSREFDVKSLQTRLDAVLAENQRLSSELCAALAKVRDQARVLDDNETLREVAASLNDSLLFHLERSPYYSFPE